MESLEARQDLFIVFELPESYLLLGVSDACHEIVLICCLAFEDFVVFQEVIVHQDVLEKILRLATRETLHTVIISNLSK